MSLSKMFGPDVDNELDNNLTVKDTPLNLSTESAQLFNIHAEDEEKLQLFLPS